VSIFSYRFLAPFWCVCHWRYNSCTGNMSGSAMRNNAWISLAVKFEVLYSRHTPKS